MSTHNTNMSVRVINIQRQLIKAILSHDTETELRLLHSQAKLLGYVSPEDCQRMHELQSQLERPWLKRSELGIIEFLMSNCDDRDYYEMLNERRFSLMGQLGRKGMPKRVSDLRGNKF